MKLSIIIPVFNEEKTITTLLENLVAVSLSRTTKEVIVVDDFSTDLTNKKIQEFKKKYNDLKFIRHSKNRGKGAAIQTGLNSATGDYILIQDADLEYNPRDIPNLLLPIQEKKADVVFGTRLNRLPDLKRDERTFRFLLHYFGNRFLSLLTSILYGTWITDMETCYKIFPRKALEKIKIKSNGFDFEPEITSKLLLTGYKIIEVPIATNPRGYNEGKKLNTIKDGIIALWTLLKLRFVR